MFNVKIKLIGDARGWEDIPVHIYKMDIGSIQIVCEHEAVVEIRATQAVDSLQGHYFAGTESARTEHRRVLRSRDDEARTLGRARGRGQ